MVNVHHTSAWVCFTANSVNAVFKDGFSDMVTKPIPSSKVLSFLGTALTDLIVSYTVRP